jgi:DNA-binding MarR family transcriptional regulator
VQEPARRFTSETLAAIESELNQLSDGERDALKDYLIDQVLTAAGVPLGDQQRRVYEAVLQLGNPRALEVARFLGENRGNTHRRLQALVRKGLIERAVHRQHVFYQPRIF